MKNRKYLFAFFLILLTTVGLAHAFVLPQQTRCMLIDLYAFEREDNLYFRDDLDEATLSTLRNTIAKAEKRVTTFWGKQTSNPKFIYCATDEDYRKFGVPHQTPAMAHLKLGSYVVISQTGIHLDIIAHELSHTEFFKRIGFYNREMKIPTWFDEGLAMQVDYRPRYSIDSLQVQSNNFQQLPDVKTMNNYTRFGSGTPDEITLNYATAKYEVAQWYTPSKLMTFIERLNDGSGFEESYDQR